MSLPCDERLKSLWNHEPKSTFSLPCGFYRVSAQSNATKLTNAYFVHVLMLAKERIDSSAWSWGEKKRTERRWENKMSQKTGHGMNSFQWIFFDTDQLFMVNWNSRNSLCEPSWQCYLTNIPSIQLTPVLICQCAQDWGPSRDLSSCKELNCAWFPAPISSNSHMPIHLAPRELVPSSGLHGHCSHMHMHTESHKQKL